MAHHENTSTDIPATHVSVRLWHPHPDGWWARPAPEDCSARLISLQRRSLACSPPLNTLTWLSICLVVRSTLCQGRTCLILGICRKFLPQFFQTGSGNVLAHLLLKVSDLQIIPQLHTSAQHRDQSKNTLSEASSYRFRWHR